jgi:hypothetical protein
MSGRRVSKTAKKILREICSKKRKKKNYVLLYYNRNRSKSVEKKKKRKKLEVKNSNKRIMIFFAAKIHNELEAYFSSFSFICLSIVVKVLLHLFLTIYLTFSIILPIFYQYVKCFLHILYSILFFF